MKRLNEEQFTALGELISEPEESEKLVKTSLAPLLLSMLFKKPECGYGLVKSLHEDFNILLSTSFVYPLLHKWAEQELVVIEKMGKKKVYRINPEKEETLLSMIQKATEAHLEFCQFLGGGGAIDPTF